MHKKEKAYSKENPTITTEEEKEVWKHIRNFILLFISLVANIVDVTICW